MYSDLECMQYRHAQFEQDLKFVLRKYPMYVHCKSFSYDAHKLSIWISRLTILRISFPGITKTNHQHKQMHWWSRLFKMTAQSQYSRRLNFLLMWCYIHNNYNNKIQRFASHSSNQRLSLLF